MRLEVALDCLPMGHWGKHLKALREARGFDPQAAHHIHSNDLINEYRRILAFSHLDTGAQQHTHGMRKQAYSDTRGHIRTAIAWHPCVAPARFVRGTTAAAAYASLLWRATRYFRFAAFAFI